MGRWEKWKCGRWECGKIGIRKMGRWKKEGGKKGKWGKKKLESRKWKFSSKQGLMSQKRCEGMKVSERETAEE